MEEVGTTAKQKVICLSLYVSDDADVDSMEHLEGSVMKGMGLWAEASPPCYLSVSFVTD